MSVLARRSLLLLLLAASGAAALLWWPPPEATADTDPTRLPVVRVEAAAAAPTTRAHVFYAATRPAEQARVAFAQPGRMVHRDVEVGDAVAEGDELAVLDLEPYRLQVAAAGARIDEIDAQAEQLERERERAARLLAADFGTAQQLEQIDAQAQALAAGRAAANAQRREASRRQRDATLRAPWSGVVAEVYAEPGEVVAAGQPILLLADPDAVEVEVEVPEAIYARLDVGMPVRVTLPLSGQRVVPGTIAQRGDIAPGVGRLFPVVVRVDDPEVVAGMAAEVHIDVPAPRGVRVPMAAVVDASGVAPTVFVVDGDVVQRVGVRVVDVALDGAVVELGAVEPGAQLVVAGHVGLADGARVEVRR